MGIPIAYTFSPFLQNQTKDIDLYRSHLLSWPLSPRREIELRYLATTGRILTALRLADIPMTIVELNRLLSNTPKRPHPMEQEALLYRQALTYIRNEWTGSSKPVTLASLEILMSVALSLPFSRISRSIRESAIDLKRLVAYIETQSGDHPLLIAGVAHAATAHTDIQKQSHRRMALLTSSLIMAKYGYDCRGMLNLEYALTRDPNAYTHALTSIGSLGQMTVWLEYFVRATHEAYMTLLQDIRERAGRTATHTQSFASLNERQKHILMLLDVPSAKVTNREVQKRFRISQITASRDLTKLVSFGFLLSSGRGRSVYYTLA